MKRVVFTNLFLLFCLYSFSQDTLARWTFPTGTASDSIADVYSALNSGLAIRALGGASSIDFTKNGFTTKCAQAIGWDGGANMKFWMIKFNSSGYVNLAISSRQQSGGNNPGPRDWKIQYKVGESGNWNDVAGAQYNCVNDWTTAFVDAVSLPADVSNQLEPIYLRWLMTSDTNSLGSAVNALGINKIDEITVSGTVYINGLPGPAIDTPEFWPNPASGTLFLGGTADYERIGICDLTGKELFSFAHDIPASIALDEIDAGIYVVSVIRKNGQRSAGKLIIY